MKYLRLMAVAASAIFLANAQDETKPMSEGAVTLSPEGENHPIVFDRFYQNYAQAITQELRVQEEPLIIINATPKEGSIAKLLALLNSDGAFKDINYQDKSMSRPELRNHVERLQSMCHYLYLLDHKGIDQAPKSFSPKDLEAGIHLALDYWLAKNPQSRNWWINDIGVPRALGKSCILFREHMSAEQWAKAQMRMRIKRSIPGGKPTGTNLSWYSESDLLCGLICNDYPLVIASLQEICRQASFVGKHEGIQVDGTYHQHGAQQQMANYGQAFANTVAFYSHLFAGTELALSKELQDNVNFLFREGFRWLLWNTSLDINTMNRQIGPNCMLNKGRGTKTCAYLLKANSNEEDRAMFDDLLNDVPLLGQKHFQESELTIHRSKDWMLSLRMHSTRLRGLESCNGDGRNVSFMADGGMYLYHSEDMREYQNIFPLWHPRRIPGVTSQESDVYLDMYRGNDSDFTGGLTDGQSGITAMELNRYGAKAFKSWVITDDWVLALGSDLQLKDEGILTTSLAQQNSFGELYVLKKGKWEIVGNSSIPSPEKEQRFYHDGMAYIVHQARDIRTENKEKTGDWWEVATAQKKAGEKMQTGKIMSLYLRHVDKEKSYRYMILPHTSPEEAACFSTSDIKVIYQTAPIHAVCYKNVYYIAVRKMQDYPDLPFDLAKLCDNKVGIYMIKQGTKGWEAQRAVYPKR